jgi:hypothetical protein
MHHSCDNQTAGVRHRPRPKTRVLRFCEKPEAHHLLPPAHGAVTVCDGEIQMPESDNRRIGHSGILPE